MLQSTGGCNRKQINETLGNSDFFNFTVDFFNYHYTSNILLAKTLISKINILRESKKEKRTKNQ